MNKTQKKSNLSKEDIIRMFGGKFTWRNGDIEIKSNAPSEDENDSPYVTEEFGLYKKYLED